MAAEFHDMGQYGDSVGWDLDFRQLDGGELDAKVIAIAVSMGVILKVEFNRSFHQVGHSPDDLLTFGVPGLDVDEFGWCSKRTRGGSLLNFNLGGGFEGVSPAGFNGHTFTFDKMALQAHAERLGLQEDVETMVRQCSYWRSPATLSLSRSLDRLTQRLQFLGEQELHDHSELLNEEIATTVIRSLVTDSSWNALGRSDTHRDILERSLAVLEDIDNLPITVDELSRRAGTSLSTLKRVFIEEFGLSPKAYIRCRCLSAVRDELAHSVPGTLIADVANRWGFWHMGQFAADYHKMFGMLPSQTIGK